MAALGTLVVNLKANTEQFQVGMRRAEQTMSTFRDAALAAVTGAAGAGLLKLAADAETLKTKLEVLLKSGTAANAMFNDIGKFAAETPFQKLDIADAAQKLLAFGVPAEKVMTTLKSIGDVSALTGSRIEELAELYGKANVQGTLFAEDINQLMGRGINVIDEFAKQLGVGKDQVKKLASEGKINFAMLEQALRDMTSGAGAFTDGSAKLSQTAAGAFSTLKDNVMQLGEAMGTVLLPVATNVMTSLTNILKNTKDLPRGLLRMGAAIVAVAVAFKALSLAQMAFAKAAVIAQAMSGPKGWVTLAAGIAIASGAMLAMDHAVAGTNAELQEVNTQIAKATGAVDSLGDSGQRAGRDLDELKKHLDTFEGLVASDADQFLIKMVAAAKTVRAISTSFGEFEARMRRVVNEQSGFNDALKGAQDALALQKGQVSDTDLQIQKFAELGVAESDLAQLREALELREEIVKQLEKEKELERQKEKALQAQKQLDALRMSDRIAAAKEQVKATQKTATGGGLAGIATRGSAAALSTIFQGASKVPEQALSEHKKANETLKALLAEQKQNRIKELTMQGAV